MTGAQASLLARFLLSKILDFDTQARMLALQSFYKNKFEPIYSLFARNVWDEFYSVHAIVKCYFLSAYCFY
jgi:hypothetical protein